MSKRDTNDAQKLRAVAAALREWGRKAGPPGRKPSMVPDEEREVARQALLVAVKHRKIFKQARHDYDCAEGVECAGVLDELNKAGAEYDRGADLGGFWHYAHDLTGKHLPGNVSFPDELDRWANRRELESAEGGKGVPDRDERLAKLMIYVQKNPGASEREIAKATGVPASTFRAWSGYQKLRKMHGLDIRKGHKTDEGDVEAYDRD
ncbi:MAG TPA: hypothetical protein VMY35_12830 [Phycisphaerae bacterium]|nr:hypothetical protein [Phycisphaerae bacterium]